jgi:kinetochore protein Spc7/SPC105
VQTLGDFFLGISQIRTQLKLLSIKYPLDVSITPPLSNVGLVGIRATAMVLLPSVRGKVYVTFVFGGGVLVEWPGSVGMVGCEVSRGYGDGFE